MSSFLAFGKDYVTSNYEKAGDPVYLHIQQTKKPIPEIWIFDIHIPLDIQRIWKRNLGRDDRCISDHGKEARFPFLDEDVIKSLLELPLWEIAELDKPAGRGDKKIEGVKLLGVEGASLLPRRAIQFSSRIARESNRKTFGSNRATNQASVRSVEIWEK
ncbi:asparagine synthetase domain-containing protein 1-like [Asparagus officinalis]|uniref:asparagine synthetase domain-containing protein 1-like n=1 Tax=Asparagus officinalis TaxID=4686 RepID=UPI00098E66E7|nr:asparagine synthetase domain-containing protein 1-like [Asparagus officinalis]